MPTSRPIDRAHGRTRGPELAFAVLFGTLLLAAPAVAEEPAHFTFNIDLALDKLDPRVKQARVICSVGRIETNMGKLSGLQALAQGTSEAVEVDKTGRVDQTVQVIVALPPDKLATYVSDSKYHNYLCQASVADDEGLWRVMMVNENRSYLQNAKQGTQPSLPGRGTLPRVGRLGPIPN